jgi:hypothetical protein
MSLLSLSLGLGVPRSEAILGVGDLVYDAAVHVESITTAIMTSATVANQVIDLTPIGATFDTASWAADVEALRQVLTEGQLLAWDVASLQQQITTLFGLESAPMTSAGFHLRSGQLRMAIVDGYSYAMRTQTLIMTTMNTVDHMLGLYHAVRDLIGNLQGQQTLSEGSVKLTQLLAEQKVITAAFQRAQSLKELSEPVMVESMKRINEQIMADHPR